MSDSTLFTYKIDRPESWDGLTIVLLHGTGGDEADLIPLGRMVAPNAVLLSVRGRSTAEPALRWFRRLSNVSFDQHDIAHEAEDFARFLPAVFSKEELNFDRTVFLGLSNGANFIGAFALLFPKRIRNAVLLRPMMVLEEIPPADLWGVRVLMITGVADPFKAYLPALQDALTSAGADVNTQIVSAGHELSRNDVTITKEWVAQLIEHAADG